MADTTVTIVVTSAIALGGNGVLVEGTVAFGADPLTYPAGGVPFGPVEFDEQVLLAPFKAPRLAFFTSSTGYNLYYDPLTERLKVFAAVPSSNPSTNPGQEYEDGEEVVPELSDAVIRFLAFFSKNQ